MSYKMPVHDTIFGNDVAMDYGTSEGARKAAQSRGSGSAKTSSSSGVKTRSWAFQVPERNPEQGTYRLKKGPITHSFSKHNSLQEAHQAAQKIGPQYWAEHAGNKSINSKHLVGG